MTNPIDTEIIHCYTQLEWSIHRIARYLERSPSSVHNALKRNDVETRPPGRPQTINHDLAAELIRRTRSTSAAAKILGCHHTSLYYAPKTP